MDPAQMIVEIQWILRLSSKEAYILKSLMQNSLVANEPEDVGALREAIFNALAEVTQP